MSDQSLEEVVQNLNEKESIPVDELVEAFDQVFYKDSDGSRFVDKEDVRGVTFSSPKSVEELVEKLEQAKKVGPSFIQIGNKEYTFDSEKDLSHFINGVRIGSES